MKPLMCILENVHTLSNFYQQLEENLPLPKYFSHNLDALYDVLSTDIENAFVIKWVGQQQDRHVLGEHYFIAIMRVLLKVKQERDDFSLVLS